ncbi:MAG: penicillin acylase family protein [Gemmatimonadaceae bacterium]
MARVSIPLVVSGLASAASLYIAACGAGPVPALGPLLDPVRGMWGAARHAELPQRATARVAGLGKDVDVLYDERGVPHIFARSELDAYRALGYVVARDRLFQLELQTRAAAGRLSDLLGPATLAADREARRLGMPRAAAAKWRGMAPDGMGRLVLDAYADGVNAYIAAIPRSGWPVEYKILGARPERWESVNSLLLFMRMSHTLTYQLAEFDRLAAQALVGQAAAAAIFPLDAPIQEPIQPNGSSSPRFEQVAIAPPGPGDSSAALRALAGALPEALRRSPNERIFASNNWAVAPRRTKNGYALLAGDPHLELNLPSVWYEAHLVVPGVLDVYGVTIPGAPGIIIGFNRDVAWSFTNTGADVLDFYRETVDDARLPTQHLVDGTWKPVTREVEIVRNRQGDAIAVDTLLFTQRGPLTKHNAWWLSMRWVPLEAPLDALGFVQAAKAMTATGYLDSMARHWPAPAQNMIAADRQGTIAIRSTGRFPLRPDSGDGLAIRDGSSSANDWLGDWPLSRAPQAVNPPQGYLASANQQPLDPRDAFAYLGSEQHFEMWRALQINRLLRADSAVTPDAMRRYQTHAGSVRAELFSSAFLHAAQRTLGRSGTAPGASLAPAHALLASWDRRYTKDNHQAILLERALGETVRLLWDELQDATGTRVATPSGHMILALLGDSANGWWDVRSTPNVRESRDDVLSRALAAAYDTLVARHGPPSPERWRWGRVAPARIGHLLALSGFSAESVAVQGGRGTLNPSAANGGFGASWRMVVELGPTVRAWGIYPGGQSGNPASTRYRDRLHKWSNGELDSLLVPAVPADLARAPYTLRLRPGN